MFYSWFLCVSNKVARLAYDWDAFKREANFHRIPPTIFVDFHNELEPAVRRRRR